MILSNLLLTAGDILQRLDRRCNGWPGSALSQHQHILQVLFGAEDEVARCAVEGKIYKRFYT